VKDARQVCRFDQSVESDMASLCQEKLESKLGFRQDLHRITHKRMACRWIWTGERILDRMLQVVKRNLHAHFRRELE
jgi:hypothetical protein